jgi:hypothetical protein
VLLQEPEFRVQHEPFRTTITQANDLVEVAIQPKVICSAVVFDACYLVGKLFRVHNVILRACQYIVH